MEGLKSLKEQELKSFLFDGKKVNTKVLLENEDGEQFPGVVEVDRYSIVDGNDGYYMTHWVLGMVKWLQLPKLSLTGLLRLDKKKTFW